MDEFGTVTPLAARTSDLSALDGDGDLSAVEADQLVVELNDVLDLVERALVRRERNQELLQ